MPFNSTMPFMLCMLSFAILLIFLLSVLIAKLHCKYKSYWRLDDLLSFAAFMTGTVEFYVLHFLSFWDDRKNCFFLGHRVIDDEENAVAYNYSFFHFMMFLATLYIMMTITNWYK